MNRINEIIHESDVDCATIELTSTNRRRNISGSIPNRSCSCACAFLSCHGCVFLLDHTIPYFPMVNCRTIGKSKSRNNVIYIQLFLAFVCQLNSISCCINLPVQFIATPSEHRYIAQEQPIMAGEQKCQRHKCVCHQFRYNPKVQLRTALLCIQIIAF